MRTPTCAIYCARPQFSFFNVRFRALLDIFRRPLNVSHFLYKIRSKNNGKKIDTILFGFFPVDIRVGNNNRDVFPANRVIRVSMVEYPPRIDENKDYSRFK